MTYLHNTFTKTPLWAFLFRWRKHILALMAFVLVTFEFIEHNSFFGTVSPVSLFEIGIYILLVFIIGLQLEFLIVTIAEKEQALHILDARHQLAIQLAHTRDWGDLVNQILQYPASRTPVTGTSLLLYQPTEKNYQTIGTWMLPEEQFIIPSLTLSEGSCMGCQGGSADTKLCLVNDLAIITSQGEKRLCYCLTLSYGGIPTGILHLYVSEKRPLSTKQSQLLGNIADEISISLLAYLQRKERQTVEISNAINAERLEIARDLHDTLGQNLGYFHLKLDQIINMQPADSLIKDVGSDLRQLRELANESYEQVRGTLFFLHQNSEEPLLHILQVYAQIIAERTGFTIDWREEGSESCLPPQTLRVFSFVFQESFRNIEKHSQASHVNVLFTWDQNKLTTCIDDNGRGFDLQQTIYKNHFGLRIMRERMETLGGHFELHSAPNQGTHITLQLPIVS
jgi:nitrate/nitrite-specific signal transduction histidine kinase